MRLCYSLEAVLVKVGLILFFSMMAAALSLPFESAQAKAEAKAKVESQANGQKAQVEFEQKKIKIRNHIIVVEVAKTNAQREQGLMFRKSLKPNQGMLFIFDQQQPLTFWMKNTLIPLSIGFFNEEKKLVDVQEMKPSQSVMILREPTYTSRSPAKYALEMNTGWFQRNGIKPGRDFFQWIPLEKTSQKSSQKK